MQHLYVMQNHLGLVKIGRSKHVELRRRRLEVADCCKIRTVKIFEGKGKIEEQIHARLQWHNAFGEWYEGGELALLEIARCLRLSRNIIWPYPLADDDEVEEWLDQLEVRREMESADKMLQRVISDMVCGPSGSNAYYRHLDGRIWMRLARFEHHEEAIYFVNEGPNGEEIYVYYDETCREKKILPFYTTELQAALSLWPELERPERWEGTVWGCCVEGLKARKLSIKAGRKTCNK